MNIILDPIFIFPLGMGVGGAGVATCISTWIACGYFCYQWYKRRNMTIICLNIKNYQVKDSIGSKTLAIGVPARLVLLLTNICDFVRNYYLGALGSDFELAGWGAVQKIGNALINIAMGIAQGARPLVAYNYACKALKRTKALVKGALLTMLIYIAAAVALVHMIPQTIVHLFVTDTTASEIAVYFLNIWTFSLIGLGFIELFNSVFQAFGKWKISLANTIINKGFLLTPVLVFLVHLFGIEGIPYSQVITENVTAVVLFGIYLWVVSNFDVE